MCHFWPKINTEASRHMASFLTVEVQTGDQQSNSQTPGNDLAFDYQIAL